MTTDHIARIVADADVLATDLFLDSSARAALDIARSHSWITLLASEHLIDQTTTLIEHVSTDTLAEKWRAKIHHETTRVTHPDTDHPALATAINGNAAHVLSLDHELASAKTGTTLQSYGDTSVKHPEAFVRLFDPAIAYEHITEDAYPGPDRSPRH